MLLGGMQVGVTVLGREPRAGIGIHKPCTTRSWSNHFTRRRRGSASPTQQYHQSRVSMRPDGFSGLLPFFQFFFCLIAFPLTPRDTTGHPARSRQPSMPSLFITVAAVRLSQLGWNQTQYLNGQKDFLGEKGAGPLAGPFAPPCLYIWPSLRLSSHRECFLLLLLLLTILLTCTQGAKVSRQPCS